MQRKLFLMAMTILMAQTQLATAQFGRSQPNNQQTLRDINKAIEVVPDSPLADNSFIKTLRGGTFAEMKFHTTANVVPRLTVSKSMLLPKDNDMLYNEQDVQFEQLGDYSSADTTPQQLLVTDLEADTLYYYVLFFHSFGQSPQPKMGTFRTKVRQTSVLVTSAKVLDDSDDLSKGEMAFTFQLFNGSQDHTVNGTSLDFVHDPERGGYHHLGTGSEYAPYGAVLQSGGVEEQIKLAISVLEDDTDEYPFTLDRVGHGIIPDQFRGIGCDDNFEWNSSVWTLPLGTGTYVSPGDTLEEQERSVTKHELTIHGNDTTCLSVQFKATVWMWYQ
ncbi:MAG: hypothetical protein AB8B50_04945 [Pirellulaceae bacterium]